MDQWRHTFRTRNASSPATWFTELPCLPFLRRIPGPYPYLLCARQYRPPIKSVAGTPWLVDCRNDMPLDHRLLDRRLSIVVKRPVWTWTSITMARHVSPHSSRSIVFRLVCHAPWFLSWLSGTTPTPILQISRLTEDQYFLGKEDYDKTFEYYLSDMDE